MQAAGDVAKVVLLRDCPSQVADAFRIARVTLNKIKQNLVWAFGYNLVAIPLAAGVLLPPAGVMLSPFVSAIMMAGSSLAVMFNSLLLKRETHRKNTISVESETDAPAANATTVNMSKSQSKRRGRQTKNPLYSFESFESPPGSPGVPRDPRELRHSPDELAVAADTARQHAPALARDLKRYSRKNAAPILPYRSAPRSEYQQDVPRAAAQMRQGHRSSKAVVQGGGRQHDIRPGDIRTMLVGQDQTGRHV